MNKEQAREILKDILWVRKCAFKYQIQDRDPVYCGRTNNVCEYRILADSDSLPECTYFGQLEIAVNLLKEQGEKL